MLTSKRFREYPQSNDKPHEVCECMCLKCMHRWIDVHPVDMWLKDIECECGAKGYIINTGQIIEEP